jgi:ATP-dependent 26S proteasome regulatory subunit
MPDPAMREALQLAIRAGNPILAIENPDEARALELVRHVAEEMPRPLYEWSITTGLLSADKTQKEQIVAEGKAAAALQHIVAAAEPAIYLFKDLGPHLKDPLVQRHLRDVSHAFNHTPRTLVLVEAVALASPARSLTLSFELRPPSIEELDEVVRKTFKKIKDESFVEVQAKINKRQMEQLVQSLRGLTCEEAARVAASVVYDDFLLNAEDLPRAVEAKRRILASTGCLESIATGCGVADIGGLKNLKAWLKQRRGGFSGQAKEFGIDEPRGVLMLGVQGCGKSLCAKVAAADWNMPLLRLDPGVLYQKFIGESESQLRQALRQAEAMAPVVLWIDEIEKAFASASSASADGGLSQRMFGTLLTWMQDHREPIFVIATANDISAVPPELMRKGRFDEVFFVDLPDGEARQNIFRIHLSRRKRDPAGFNVALLAQKAEGFSGAEIEQAVISALYRAFAERAPLTDDHVLAEIRATRPLSVLLAEKIEALRAWARDRCVPAD